jgi:peptide-methionine (S)-S-oxide reductase
VGSQYRSAVFFHSPEQREVAEAVKEREQSNFKRPIATEIEPATTFWPAEDYHQRYLEKRGLATCRI